MAIERRVALAKLQISKSIYSRSTQPSDRTGQTFQESVKLCM